MMLHKVRSCCASFRGVPGLLLSVFLFGSVLVGRLGAFDGNAKDTSGSIVVPTQLPAALSEEELMGARIFSEPLIPIGKVSRLEDAEDRAGLAKVLNAYWQSGDAQDRLAVEAYLEANPRSRWRASALANLGRDYYQAGYFSKALAAWEKAWELGKEATEPKAKATMDWAIGEAAALNAKLGRFDRLREIFKDVEGRVFTGPSTELMSGARQGLWLMEHEPGLAFRCGPMALDRIRTFRNPEDAFDARLLESRSTQRGMSLLQVHQLAESLGMEYQMAKREQKEAPMLLPSVVHWKLGHFGALLEEVGGKYRMEDPTFKAVLHLGIEAINEESSGYYLVPRGALPVGWRSVSEEEAGGVTSI